MASKLSAELARGRRWHGFLANLQQNGIEFAIFVGIIASAVTTSEWLDEPYSKIAAGLPGVVLLIERQLRYRVRWQWHADYRARLQELARRIRDEQADEKQISRELSKLDIDMRASYPKPLLRPASDGTRG